MAFSKKGGVSEVLAGLVLAGLGLIVLTRLLPVLNDFIDEIVPLTDDGTALVLNLIPITLVAALLFGVIRLSKRADDPPPFG